MKEGEYTHIPVLPEQTLALWTGSKTKGRFIDCTVGCGGHSALLLEKLPEAELLAIDRDDEALERAGERLSFAAGRVHFRKGRFSELAALAHSAGWEKADGILMDIGVSSPQIDDPARGFSFRKDGPLDMRMDRSSELSASRVVNQYGADELAEVFRKYGEMDGRDSRNLASAIAEKRTEKPFTRTCELADLCEEVLRRGHSRRKGPPLPTLCFQALRIEVNGELDELEKGLNAAVDLLNPGGRLCVISFHSLEDRIVKNFFREMAVECKCPPGIPVCICGWKPKLKILTKHPETADKKESFENTRAACAKLRAAEKREEKGS